jgi:hypothetical protein
MCIREVRIKNRPTSGKFTSGSTFKPSVFGINSDVLMLSSPVRILILILELIASGIPLYNKTRKNTFLFTTQSSYRKHRKSAQVTKRNYISNIQKPFY